MERLPFEELVVEVEVDALVAADVQATANLYAPDGAFVTPGSTFSSLAPGLGMLEFHFSAFDIFSVGHPGPFSLQLLSILGTTADETAVSLLAPAWWPSPNPIAWKTSPRVPASPSGGQ